MGHLNRAGTYDEDERGITSLDRVRASGDGCLVDSGQIQECTTAAASPRFSTSTAERRAPGSAGITTTTQWPCRWWGVRRCSRRSHMSNHLDI
jgi:hypothetical protein